MENKEKGRIILLAVLYFALAVLVVLNAYMEKYSLEEAVERMRLKTGESGENTGDDSRENAGKDREKAEEKEVTGHGSDVDGRAAESH